MSLRLSSESRSSTSLVCILSVSTLWTLGSLDSRRLILIVVWCVMTGHLRRLSPSRVATDAEVLGLPMGGRRLYFSSFSKPPTPLSSLIILDVAVDRAAWRDGRRRACRALRHLPCALCSSQLQPLAPQLLAGRCR